MTGVRCDSIKTYSSIIGLPFEGEFSLLEDDSVPSTAAAVGAALSFDLDLTGNAVSGLGS